MKCLMTQTFIPSNLTFWNWKEPGCLPPAVSHRRDPAVLVILSYTKFNNQAEFLNYSQIQLLTVRVNTVSIWVNEINGDSQVWLSQKLMLVLLL